MEVAHGHFDTGQFTDVVDGFHGVGSIGVTSENFNVLEHARGQEDGVKCVKGIKTGGPIEGECVHVEVGEVCLEEFMPQFCCRLAPVLQNNCFGDGNFCGVVVVDVYFAAVTN